MEDRNKLEIIEAFEKIPICKGTIDKRLLKVNISRTYCSTSIKKVERKLPMCLAYLLIRRSRTSFTVNGPSE